MDYFLDEDVEMELLSAIAFEDDIMTQDEQQLDDNTTTTTTIPESQPLNTEAATSSMEAANSTEVAASPNEAGRSRLLSLLELKLPPLRFEAATPHPSNISTVFGLRPHLWTFLERGNYLKFL